METGSKKIIMIALIMAVLTTFLVYIYIRKATTIHEVVEYINVYVAAKTLPQKHLIVEGDLKVTKVTREFINPQTVRNKEDIVGKRLKDSIIEGEQILKDRLVDDGKQILAFNIPKDKRAISININEQVGVSYLMRPGDFVDVIATFQKEEVEDKINKYVMPGITKTIIQNVEVLALGQEQVIIDEKLKELPKTVTLAVSPQDAEKLVFSSEFGVLRLSLRPVDDNKNIDTQGIIRNDAIPNKGQMILAK